MDIKGFGATYIMELVHLGYLKDIADIYDLKQHREELIEQGIIGKEKIRINYWMQLKIQAK